MRKPTSGGGLHAIRYTLSKAREVGPVRLWRAMRAKNACKTCAVGMGGQLGGMVNEERHFPELCKKTLQAMAADMQGRVEPKFFRQFPVENLQSMSPRELEQCGRLVDPVVLDPGETHYRTISWDEAIDQIAQALKQAKPEKSFYYASGRSSNEAGFLLQLLGRAQGTNHVTNCSYYCHSASGFGLMDSLGSGTSTCRLEDLDQCDMVFLIGGNPASNHPRLITKLMELRNRGGRVIVVNPMRERGLENFRVPSRVRSLLFGTKIASTYIQPVIGGDIAFMSGVAKALLEIEGAQLDCFIKNHTEGFEPLRTLLVNLDWPEIEAASHVSRIEMEDVARKYAKSNGAIFMWTMGITHHVHGVQNVHWIANLALLRGMVGRPGAGLMPIRGHSNVQGIGTVLVKPKVAEEVLQRLEDKGIARPGFKGYDTLETLEAADRGEMEFALCLGGNLFGASPDANYVHQAMAKIDTVVYMNTSLNSGHAYGLGKRTLILPVLPRDEEDQPTTQESMFNYVRISDGGPRRHEGPRTEVAILSEIAHRGLGSSGVIHWKQLESHDAIRQLIAEFVPELAEVAEAGRTKKEFEIPGRVIHEPKFHTQSGRANFHADAIPAAQVVGPNQVRLMTIRSEGQFNTVVYEEKDMYRGQERRDIILMSAATIDRLGLKPDQRVDVFNDIGAMRGIRVREFTIADDCAAMYCPESNVLIPRTRDPRSKTPAYKSVIVTLRPATDRLIQLSETPGRPSHPSSRSRMKAC